MIQDVPIIVLCGGLGTRLRETVPDSPKVLAPFQDKTLLDMIIEDLEESGFKKIILSVGFRKEQVISHCASCGYAVTFSEESEPLGTGGALKAALPYVKSDHFFVMNGDMVFDPDFAGLYDFHLKNQSALSLALTRRYVGTGGNVVIMDTDHRVIDWRAKTDTDQGDAVPLNAGVYLMSRDVQKHFPPENKFSLEQDIFPVLFKTGACFGMEHDGVFIDIGVPDRYKTALEFVGQQVNHHTQ